MTQRAWQWLRHELDRWAEDGNYACFWWRDDDTTKPTAKLQQLAELSSRYRAPLALAVIPARVEPALAEFLQKYPSISVLQHGYAHQNHAPPGQRKLELGGDYDRRSLSSELTQGMNILAQQLEGRFLPVLVPPWNRIDDDILLQLKRIGFTGISTMKARRETYAAPGVLSVNTHLDPVNWRHGSGFIGTYPAIAILIQHLIAKRSGYRDRDEPTGLLTHHLAQNAAVTQFTEDLLQLLDSHPAVNWLDAGEIWR